jgi:SlyX protein
MSDNAALSARIDGLETRIAFQDKTLEELSGVLAQQQQLIDQLKAKIKDLVVQLGNSVSDSGNEPPPHY